MFGLEQAQHLALEIEELVFEPKPITEDSYINRLSKRDS